MALFSGKPSTDRPLTNPRRDLRATLIRARRRVLRHRRGLAAGLAAVAAYIGIQAATAPPPATVPTWVAAHDLPSGTVLTSDDLTRAPYAPGTVPVAAIRDPKAVLGRTLAAPLDRGVPVTRDDVIGEGWLRDRAGMAAVPLRITDPQVVGLLSVGDTVRLVAADPQAPDDADVLADDAVVLAVPGEKHDVDSSLAGRLVVFGVRDADAPHVEAVATARYVSVVWNP